MSVPVLIIGRGGAGPTPSMLLAEQPLDTLADALSAILARPLRALTPSP